MKCLTDYRNHTRVGATLYTQAPSGCLEALEGDRDSPRGREDGRNP